MTFASNGFHPTRSFKENQLEGTPAEEFVLNLEQVYILGYMHNTKLLTMVAIQACDFVTMLVMLHTLESGSSIHNNLEYPTIYLLTL